MYSSSVTRIDKLSKKSRNTVPIWKINFGQPFVANYNLPLCSRSRVFVKFQTLIKPNVLPDYLSKSKLYLTDVNDVQHIYVATAFLMISRYSDSITVVKQDRDGHAQYTDDHYSTRVNISHSRFSDLIVTSGSLLVFYCQVR